MANVKFYLKNPKASKSSIFFRLSYGAYKIVDGKKKYILMQYHTDETINPKYWNSKKGEAKQVSTFPEYPEFNARLKSITNTVLNILRRLKNDGISPNNDVLKHELDLVFRKDRDKTEKVAEQELMDFIPFFIDTCDRSIGTKKSYKVVQRDLQEYEQENDVKLTFSSITIDFYNAFVAFLKSKNYVQNTIGTRIKILKTFMNEAHERNLHTNLDYRKNSFVKPKEDTVKVYLNKNELLALYKLDLSENKKYEQVRDWFLIAAYTGLRISDLSRLTKENITNSTIRIKTKKTNTLVVIPIHSLVNEMFEKYNYQLPQIISDQKFNDYIKDVVELAGIDDDVLIEQTKGNSREKIVAKKYKLVSAHTARRSFATNALKEGVPASSLMKITGHKTEKAFLSYIKITEQENAELLQNHPFFNQNLK